MHDPNLVARASGFHPWDAMAPAALSGILQRGPFRSTAETGCGGSTIVLSHASQYHVTFAIEGENRTITELRKQEDLRTENVVFVEGETKDTLPAKPDVRKQVHELDLRQRIGMWPVQQDQVCLPLKLMSMVLEEVVVRTAFFGGSKRLRPDRTAGLCKA